MRGEFAKAHDLRVSSYFIWSFYEPSEKLVAGARKLGLDLTSLGFDTHLRAERLDPLKLMFYAANALYESSQAARFARALLGAADDTRRKLMR